MAKNTDNQQATTTDAPAEKAAPFDFATVTPVDSIPVKHVRAEKANPLLDAVRASKDREAPDEDGKMVGASLAITVPLGQSDKAVSLLRRAAQALDCGIAVVVDNQPDGSRIVRYQTKPRRNYTRS